MSLKRNFQLLAFSYVDFETEEPAKGGTRVQRSKMLRQSATHDEASNKGSGPGNRR